MLQQAEEQTTARNACALPLHSPPALSCCAVMRAGLLKEKTGSGRRFRKSFLGVRHKVGRLKQKGEWLTKAWGLKKRGWDDKTMVGEVNQKR